MKKDTSIRVYMTHKQRQALQQLADNVKLSLSEYLLMKGMDKPIKSDRQKAELAAVACDLYAWGDSLEEKVHREKVREFGGRIYGALED